MAVEDSDKEDSKEEYEEAYEEEIEEAEVDFREELMSVHRSYQKRKEEKQETTSKTR
jgi:hypothetical protein